MLGLKLGLGSGLGSGSRSGSGSGLGLGSGSGLIPLPKLIDNHLPSFKVGLSNILVKILDKGKTFCTGNLFGRTDFSHLAAEHLNTFM